MAFAFTLAPNTHKRDLITTAVIVTATTITRTNIGGSGGTGTIIGTITIEIMIGTTTGIDASRFSSDHNLLCCDCRNNRLIDGRGGIDGI
jgi:hypothetical protein